MEISYVNVNRALGWATLSPALQAKRRHGVAALLAQELLATDANALPPATVALCIAEHHLPAHGTAQVVHSLLPPTEAGRRPQVLHTKWLLTVVQRTAPLLHHVASEDGRTQVLLLHGRCRREAAPLQVAVVLAFHYADVSDSLVSRTVSIAQLDAAVAEAKEQARAAGFTRTVVVLMGDLNCTHWRHDRFYSTAGFAEREQRGESVERDPTAHMYDRYLAVPGQGTVDLLEQLGTLSGLPPHTRQQVSRGNNVTKYSSSRIDHVFVAPPAAWEVHHVAAGAVADTHPLWEDPADHKLLRLQLLVAPPPTADAPAQHPAGNSELRATQASCHDSGTDLYMPRHWDAETRRERALLWQGLPDFLARSPRRKLNGHQLAARSAVRRVVQLTAELDSALRAHLRQQTVIRAEVLAHQLVETMRTLGALVLGKRHCPVSKTVPLVDTQRLENRRRALKHLEARAAACTNPLRKLQLEDRVAACKAALKPALPWAARPRALQFAAMASDKKAREARKLALNQRDARVHIVTARLQDANGALGPPVSSPEEVKQVVYQDMGVEWARDATVRPTGWSPTNPYIASLGEIPPSLRRAIFPEGIPQQRPQLSQLMAPATESALQEALRQCDPDTACGHTQIPVRLWHHLPPVLLRAATAITRAVFWTGAVPDALNTVIIRLLPKDGAPHTCIEQGTKQPLRPIALTNVLTRGWERILKGRINAALPDLPHIPPAQAGFRPGGSTRPPTVAHSATEWLAAASKKELHYAQYDSSRAYDRVAFWALALNYQACGFPRRFTQLIISLCKAPLRFITAHGLTEPHYPQCGLGQGRVLAPHHWCVQQLPILRALSNSRVAPPFVPPAPPGCLSPARRDVQAFADDLTAYAPTAAALAAKTSALKAYMALTNGQINDSKTQYVAVLNGQRVGGLQLPGHPEIVSTATPAQYLGGCTPASDEALATEALLACKNVLQLTTVIPTLSWLLGTAIIPRWQAAARTGGSLALLANARKVDAALARLLVAHGVVPALAEKRAHLPVAVGGYGVASFEQAVSSGALSTLAVSLAPCGTPAYGLPPLLAHWYAIRRGAELAQPIWGEHLQGSPPARLRALAKRTGADKGPATPTSPLATAYAAAAACGLTVHIRHDQWYRLLGTHAPQLLPTSQERMDSALHELGLAAAWPANAGDVGVDGSVKPGIAGHAALAAAAAVPTQGSPLFAVCDGLVPEQTMSSFVPEAVAAVCGFAATHATLPLVGGHAPHTQRTVFQDNQAVIRARANTVDAAAWPPSAFRAGPTYGRKQPALQLLLRHARTQPGGTAHTWVKAHMPAATVARLHVSNPSAARAAALNHRADVLAGVAAASPAAATFTAGAADVTEHVTAAVAAAWDEVAVLWARQQAGVHAAQDAVPASMLRPRSASRWHLPQGQVMHAMTSLWGGRAVRGTLSASGAPQPQLAAAITKAVTLRARVIADASQPPRHWLWGIPSFRAQRESLAPAPVQSAPPPCLASALGVHQVINPQERAARARRALGPDLVRDSSVPDRRYVIAASPLVDTVSAVLSLACRWHIDPCGREMTDASPNTTVLVSNAALPCVLGSKGQMGIAANWPRVHALRARSGTCPPWTSDTRAHLARILSMSAVRQPRVVLAAQAVEAVQLEYPQLDTQHLCTPWSARPSLLSPQSYCRAEAGWQQELTDLLHTSAGAASPTSWAFVELLSGKPADLHYLHHWFSAVSAPKERTVAGLACWVLPGPARRTPQHHLHLEALRAVLQHRGFTCKAASLPVSGVPVQLSSLAGLRTVLPTGYTLGTARGTPLPPASAAAADEGDTLQMWAFCRDGSEDPPTLRLALWASLRLLKQSLRDIATARTWTATGPAPEPVRALARRLLLHPQGAQAPLLRATSVRRDTGWWSTGLGAAFPSPEDDHDGASEGPASPGPSAAVLAARMGLPPAARRGTRHLGAASTAAARRVREPPLHWGQWITRRFRRSAGHAGNARRLLLSAVRHADVRHARAFPQVSGIPVQECWGRLAATPRPGAPDAQLALLHILWDPPEGGSDRWAATAIRQWCLLASLLPHCR